MTALAGPDRDRTIRARYRTTCAACDGAVELGSPIQCDDDKRWLHLRCWEERQAIRQAVGRELEEVA